MESTSLAEQQRILASDWGGGKSPFGTSWSKFMMWIFIISDALTFAGFLIAYGFMRARLASVVRLTTGGPTFMRGPISRKIRGVCRSFPRLSL